MLKDIRLHLATDEALQHQLEQQLSEKIVFNHRRSVNAFARYIPSLVADVRDVTTQNIAIFANKNAQYNIVDYGTGRTMYGLNPDAEIYKQFSLFTRHAPYISLTGEAAAEIDNSANELTALSSYQQHQALAPLPPDVNVLVVFGLGLGYHIRELVERYQITHLIVYEPERQYFQCSILTTDWLQLLQTMDAKGTSVYLQIGKDGRDLLSDMEELAAHVPVGGFYFYKHYNHTVFDAVDYGLRHKSWAQLQKDGFKYAMHNEPNLYLPIWSESITLEQYQTVGPDDEQFVNNLAAFKKYFPAIYKEFKNYQPQDWLPVKRDNGDVNLIQKISLVAFNGESARDDALTHFEHFNHHPQKDGLVLGYNGTKLKKYLHYQFVANTEKLLRDVSDEAGQLPETVKSMIMFGIGLGYQLEALFDGKTVEKLFLCEPNRDFFYASLFAIDWQGILTTIDENDSRIYINIGDDGTHLFRDLLSQFYSVGPYILASTYFYQTYYNANLVQALVQLREQLQIVISMGEYYDHARYGIAHTTEIISQGYPLLQAKPAKYLTAQDKDVAVFIVGNGPSLDDAISAIKEWQGRAIVVSCGTALMPLYKNSITPDFHAEIEQNRSTFDWICRVGDFDYLKQITLISCNGIHPDTCALFANVFIAFKAGESSTACALNVLNRKKYEELEFAFPTVSNFAVNVFSQMGFNQMYLFGVDLGFADQNKHHSSLSGYYNNDGKEAYNYREKNNTSIVVPGNFKKTIFTKHEFKVSKEILEQTLNNQKIDCYNTSDGARIKGASPLQTENILLVNSAADKDSALAAINQRVFLPAPEFTEYKERFADKYQPKTLEFELNGMLELIRQPIIAAADAEELITRQKDMLFASYSNGKSLLFYLLYGTVNYANSVFSKLVSQTSLKLETLQQAKDFWEAFLTQCAAQQHYILSVFDLASSMANHRERVFLSRKVLSYWEVAYIQTAGAEPIAKAISGGTDGLKVKALSTPCLGATALVQGQFDEQVFTLEYYNSPFQYELSGQTPAPGTLAVFYPEVISSEQHLNDFFDGKYPFANLQKIGFSALRCFTLGKAFKYVIPKLAFLTSMDNAYREFLASWVVDLPAFEQYVDFPSVIAVPRDPLAVDANVFDDLGSRGRVCLREGLIQDLLLITYERSMEADFARRLGLELK